MAPALLGEPGGLSSSSSKMGYHNQGMIQASSLMMRLGEGSPFLEADCHNQGTIPAPPLTTELRGETESFSEVDCHIPGIVPTRLSMMGLEEGFSPLWVGYHTQDTSSWTIERCSGLRMDFPLPQVGREVRAHVRALMAIASGIAVVAHGRLA